MRMSIWTGMNNECMYGIDATLDDKGVCACL